jgi:hypothetical protein
VFYLEKIDLDNDLSPFDRSDQSCLYTRDHVTARMGVEALRWMPAHVPQLYDRDLLGEIETLFQSDFDRTRNSVIRSPGDFVLKIAYASIVASRGQLIERLFSGTKDYSFLRLQSKILGCVSGLRYIYRKRPRFYCINDELGDSMPDRMLRWIVRRFLEMYYPKQSGYEQVGSF